MRRQVIALALTATAAQAWVPMPSFSGLTRSFGAAEFSSAPHRDLISRPVSAILGAGRARLPQSALFSTRMVADIYSTVNEGVKEAMKAKDKERLQGLRGIKAVFQSAAKDKGTDTLADAECIVVLRRLSKQRQESIDAYVQAGRDELAAAEKSELAVINSFLPALADEATTRKWVEEAIAESGATSASMMGKVMGVLMKKHKADMDGSLAKNIAEDIFKNADTGGGPVGADSKGMKGMKNDKTEGTTKDKTEPPAAKKASNKDTPAAKKEDKKPNEKKSKTGPTASDTAPAAAAPAAAAAAAPKADKAAAPAKKEKKIESKAGSKEAGADAPVSAAAKKEAASAGAAAKDAEAAAQAAQEATVVAAKRAEQEAAARAEEAQAKQAALAKAKKEEEEATAKKAAEAKAAEAKAAEEKQIAADKAAEEAKAKKEEEEATAKKAAEVKAAEEKQIAADKAAEEAKIAAIKKAEQDRIAAEKAAEERAIAEAKAAQEAKIVAEKKAEEERVAAEKAAEEARIAAHMTAGHAAVKEAEEAVASGNFEAAWAAQDAAAKQFGLGGSSSSQLSTVAALTDKIAAAELLARKAAFQKEGDEKYLAAVQSVEAEEVSGARASLAEAAECFTKAGVDAGAALKELKTKIEAAEVSVALREKLAAKIAKKETKKREVQARMAEEDARKEAERKAILAAEQAKRDAVKAKLLRERELINLALAGPAGRERDEVPELKTLARPSVSAEDLEKARMTGTEIAAAKLAEAKDLVQREKDAVKATKVQQDAMRKVAEIEGDRLFAAAEAALASGDVDAAKANEKAATATYQSRKIARTTILRKLRAQITDTVKKQAADLKDKERMEATERAQEEAQRKAEEARIAQVKAFEETAARAAAIQAKSGAKVPLFLASQMASASSEPAMAPSGPPKMAPELRAAAQVTGSELNAAKKLQLEEAKKTAKADAKVAAEQAKMAVDVLVKAADDVMEQAQASVSGLDFTQARGLQTKAMAMYKQANVNRSSSLKNLEMQINKSEKQNAATAAAAQKKRIADEKAAVQAVADAETEAARKVEVARQVSQIRAAADKQSELSAKGGVKVPLFMASQMAQGDSAPALKAPPRGGGAPTEQSVVAPTEQAPPPAVSSSDLVEKAPLSEETPVPPTIQAPPLRQATEAPVAAAPAALATPAKAASAAAFDDTPPVDWGAKLDAIRKASSQRLGL